jgi:hypothetical protein
MVKWMISKENKFGTLIDAVMNLQSRLFQISRMSSVFRRRF